MRLKATLTIGLLLCGLQSTASADYIKIRFGPYSILLEGSVGARNNRIKSFVHRKFRDVKISLYYRVPSEPIYIEDMFLDVPSFKQQFNRKSKDAEKDTAKLNELAGWTVKHGLIDAYQQTLEALLERDPNDAYATKVLSFKEKLDQPLPDSDHEQKYIEGLLKRKMNFKTSEHYILAYDTSDERAEERLELLEKVYETFYLFFAHKGRFLEIPEERLMVVLYADHKTYLDFSTKLSPSLASTAGFFSPEENIAVFFAQATLPINKELTEMSAELEAIKRDAKKQNRVRGVKVTNLGDVVRLADTVKILQLVQMENEDVEVVSHEATHQLAANSALFPRQVRIPRWAHEGLAAYFESPKEATWSGVGAVNELRLAYYRVLSSDTDHSNIDFIVSDDVYNLAASHGATLHAYGQAWALTHFLIEHHFDKLDLFWRTLSRLPADTIFSEVTLKKCFDEVFGKDRTDLNAAWRQHMGSLKSDTEKLLGTKEAVLRLR